MAGYECNFVSEPDDSLKCLICLEVARDPWQHGKCGRLFCEACLDENGEDKPCPNCRMEDPVYLEDTKSKREIKALRVKCDNVEEGCGWTGNLGTLRTHLKACECIVVSCKYGSIGCDMKMIRKDMEAHEQDDKAHLHQALDTVVKLQTSLMTVGSLKFKITEKGREYAF